MEDLYGRDGFSGTVSSGVDANLVNGQFLEFVYTFPTGSTTPSNDYYTGTVLTFTSGAFSGRSTRIVESRVVGLDLTFIVEGIGGSPAVDDAFYVNGRPFNGTGHGFDDESNTEIELYGLLDLNNDNTGDIPVAIVPTIATAQLDTDLDGTIDLGRFAFEGGATKATTRPIFRIGLWDGRILVMGQIQMVGI